MESQIKALDERTFRDCVKLGGSVALVRVVSAKASNQGTRGARVHVEYVLEQGIHGTTPRQASFWLWGGLDNALIGGRLIVALKYSPENAKDVGLLSSVLIPKGQEEEAVRQHKEVLARMERSVDVLDSQSLHAYAQGEGSIAVVRVTKVGPTRQGSQGYEVRLGYELEQALHGQPPRQASFWVAGGPDAVRTGQQLVVALMPGSEDAAGPELELMDFVRVPKGQESEAIRLHREALQK
ncbi:hypothetical protein NVS55_38970 [Myxococcus stipitatus]|uniref:hypothetical protein n=1 Tax=Myxococcus stipitatus TaxID=83455 RepID=UPI003145307B